VSVTLSELALGGPAAPWEALGFATEDETLRIGTVTLRFTGSAPAGIQGWALSGASGDLDGLPTTHVEAAAPAAPAEHPNGARRLDHVVVFTPDLERTFSALNAAGLDLRRVREAGSPEHPVSQGFYRLGEVILEVVGDVEPEGPARFWGLVVIVDDLDALAERVGEHLGAPRDAVQPGRRIATVRESAGLDVPVAFMTPDSR
jgi:hypothetical protein